MLVNSGSFQGQYDLPREYKEGPDSPEEIKLNQRQVIHTGNTA
jgi:hypothetical protein